MMTLSRAGQSCSSAELGRVAAVQSSGAQVSQMCHKADNQVCKACKRVYKDPCLMHPEQRIRGLISGAIGELTSTLIEGTIRQTKKNKFLVCSGFK